MENLNQILQLPESTLVNKKITKAFFKRNFDLTLTERKLVEDANTILQIDWIASLKPQNSNVPSFADGTSTYEEVQVICVKIGEVEFEKGYIKVIELIQKYIPYHVILIVHSENLFVWNTTSKKVNLNDSSKRTIEKSLTSEVFYFNRLTERQKAFLKNCTFENSDKHDLRTLYHSYESNIAALQASVVTGEFIPRPIERANTDVRTLEEIKRLEKEIIQLQSQAKKEIQLNTQVQLNSEVQHRRKEIEKLKQKLQA